MALKKLILICYCGLLSASSLLTAQGSTYSFKPFKHLEHTAVKNQHQTGTCWAFSTASFLESEVKRISQMDVDLSEMYIVRQVYKKKCENFVRRQGTAQLDEGGLAHDLINAVHEVGIVPEDVYPGRKDVSEPFNHAALVKKLKNLCSDFVKKGKDGSLPKDWLQQIDSVLDEEFGVLPKKFSVGNRLFTPTIYRDYLGINSSDYITLTSFTHHPFHQDIILEIPDNFANGTMYNVPIDEMMRALNYSVQQGYTATWDADVSNDGFSAQNGLAILPAVKWAEKTDKEQTTTFQSTEREMPVSQEYRQDLFDQQVTMDDHLMHIVGIDNEVSNASIFYLVKNSWGTISDAKGYIRASEPYLRLNTISITVNKKALPLDLQQRLGVAEGEPAIQHSVPAVREEAPKPAAPAKQPGKVMKMTPVAKKAAPGYDN